MDGITIFLKMSHKEIIEILEFHDMYAIAYYVNKLKKENTTLKRQVAKLKKSEITLYSGTAWKHHVAEDFERKINPAKTFPNGVMTGGTIFTNFDKMVEYLKKDGRDWYIAKLTLNKEPLKFEFNNNYMATVLTDYIYSNDGFKPLKNFV